MGLQTRGRQYVVYLLFALPKAEGPCMHAPLPSCASTPRNGDPEAVSLLLLTHNPPPPFLLFGWGTGASAIPCAVGGRKISARCNKEHSHIVRKGSALSKLSPPLIPRSLSHACSGLYCCRQTMLLAYTRRHVHCKRASVYRTAAFQGTVLTMVCALSNDAWLPVSMATV